MFLTEANKTVPTVVSLSVWSFQLHVLVYLYPPLHWSRPLWFLFHVYQLFWPVAPIVLTIPRWWFHLCPQLAHISVLCSDLLGRMQLKEYYAVRERCECLDFIFNVWYKYYSNSVPMLRVVIAIVVNCIVDNRAFSGAGRSGFTEFHNIYIKSLHLFSNDM